MDEFEKIRAFSEEMSRQTEQAAAQEQAEVAAHQVSSSSNTKAPDENLNFLEEWSATKPAMVSESKTISKTFWIVLGLTSVVLIALIVVLWLLMRVPMEKGEVVSIAPTPTPVKVKPENPGGMIIPDQDKEIYTRLNQEDTPVKVERLFDVPEEQPVLPPVVEEPEVVPFAEIEPDSLEVETEVVQPEEVAPVEEVKPAPQPEKKVEPAPKKEPVKKETAVKDKWRVQLFSSSDKAKVEKTWKTILKKHKGLLSDTPMTIEKADIAGKGTFYRLKVGEFSTKQRATTLCQKLKKQKQDCFPVK